MKENPIACCYNESACAWNFFEPFVGDWTMKIRDYEIVVPDLIHKKCPACSQTLLSHEACQTIDKRLASLGFPLQLDESGLTYKQFAQASRLGSPEEHEGSYAFVQLTLEDKTKYVAFVLKRAGFTIKFVHKSPYKSRIVGLGNTVSVDVYETSVVLAYKLGEIDYVRAFSYQDLPSLIEQAQSATAANLKFV